MRESKVHILLYVRKNGQWKSWGGVQLMNENQARRNIQQAAKQDPGLINNIGYIKGHRTDTSVMETVGNFVFSSRGWMSGKDFQVFERQVATSAPPRMMVAEEAPPPAPPEGKSEPGFAPEPPSPPPGMMEPARRVPRLPRK